MNIIGIISDTHRQLPDKAIDIFRGAYDRAQVVESIDLAGDGAELPLRAVDHIVHAGDIGDPSRPRQDILDRLSEIAPVHAVLGNCDVEGYALDGREIKRDALEADIDGLRILVAHEPQDLQAARKRVTVSPMLCVHGHTHAYKMQQRGEEMLLCPGSIHEPRNDRGLRTVSLVYAEGSQLLRIEIVRL